MALATSRKLARNPQLRRLMAAWSTFYAGSNAHAVLVIVFVFSAGGAAAVGAATVARVLPGGLVAPLVGGLATSSRPQLHLAIGIGARVVTMIGTVISVLTRAPVDVVLVLVAVDSLASAGVRPLHGALVVRLAETAGEAAAANAVTRSLVSAGALAGPAMAGVALGFVGIGWAFSLPAAAFAAGAAAALRIRVPPGDHEPQGDGRRRREVARSHLLSVGAGFHAILANRPAAAATLLSVVNIVLLGIWYVVSASVATDLLGLGEGGITTIAALNGAGGLVAALGTLSIVGRHRLAPVLAGVMVVLGVTFVALGETVLPAAGLALAAGAGAATAVVYAIAPTLVQRCVPRKAMVSAAASQQSLAQVANAAGATVAPLLIRAVGVTAALAIVGGAAIAITVAVWPMLRRADDLSAEDATKLAVIKATPAFAPLPALALEQLARAATRLRVPAGSEVIRQHDSGDRFYMIAAGVACVTVDGRRVATLGPGGSFGEIALLHDVPRSATVTAQDDLDLVVVDRAEFLAALSVGDNASARLGAVSQARLATPPVEDRLVEVDPGVALRGRSVVELLAAQPPLAALSARALAELADTARVVSAPDGALITREGDYGCTYYVILDGAVQVVEHETPVRVLGSGDSFGERAIVRDVPRTATVRAAGDTALLAVNREAFQRARGPG